MDNIVEQVDNILKDCVRKKLHWADATCDDLFDRFLDDDIEEFNIINGKENIVDITFTVNDRVYKRGLMYDTTDVVYAWYVADVESKDWYVIHDDCTYGVYESIEEYNRAMQC